MISQSPQEGKEHEKSHTPKERFQTGYFNPPEILQKVELEEKEILETEVEELTDSQAFQFVDLGVRLSYGMEKVI